MRCPSCGATNPDSAAWCSLCLTKLGTGGAAAPRYPTAGGEPAPGPGPVPLDAPPAAGPAPGPGPLPLDAAPSARTGHEPGPQAASRGVVRRGDEITWRCPGCDRENRIEDDRCPVCGTSLFRVFGPAEPPRPPRPPRNPTVAAVLSVVPGAGHIYVRRAGEGAVRVVLAAWWLGAALVIDPSIGFFAPLRLVYLVALLALAAVSALDAYREAKAPASPPVLSRKVVLWAATSLVGLSVVWLLLGAMAARR